MWQSGFWAEMVWADGFWLDSVSYVAAPSGNGYDREQVDSWRVELMAMPRVSQLETERFENISGDRWEQLDSNRGEQQSSTRLITSSNYRPRLKNTTRH